MDRLIVSPSPHIHSGDTIERNMYAVLIALLPAVLVGLSQFGLGALIVILVSIGFCALTEWLIAKYLYKQDYNSLTDGSALITGLLLAMNVPSNLSWWIVAIGAVVAIGVGKMSFGGLGGNIFNPALVGRVFLLIAYPAQMTTWPTTGQLMSYTDATTGATPLGIMKGVLNGAPGVSLNDLPSAWNLFIGLTPGSLGEISAAALLLGLIYLLYKRVITWHIPVSILVSALVTASVIYLIDPTHFVAPYYHLLTGGMMLGAVFMATDYVSSPMTKSGQLIYGCLIGMLTVIIRSFGAYPEGMSFAILIMNGFTPLINMYTSPKHFGDR